MLNEQVALQLHDGTLSLIFHAGTGAPYYLREFCKIYHRQHSENVEKSTKSETVKAPQPWQKGHRKPLFTTEQEAEIVHKYTHNNTPKNALAKEYRCSEKTIRNIIKRYYNTH